MFVSIRKSAESISKQVLTAIFSVSHVLIPLGVMSFYFVASSWLLPEGVNKTFAATSEKYVVLVTILLYIAFFAISDLRKAQQQHSVISGEKEWSAADLLLVLLPLTPIMQYIVNNDDVLSLSESALLFCAFALFASLPILIIPLLLRNTGSARQVMAVGLAFAFSITYMASLSQQFAWYEVGSLNVQLAAFGIVWFVSWLLFHLNYRSLLYLLVIVYFLANSIFQLMSQGVVRPASADEPDNELVTLVDSKEPVITPNIYLLVYDAYVANETLLAHGIDNGPQEQYLEGLGFRIYPHTYSVEANTLTTMSRVLSASDGYFDNSRTELSGDGVVQNLLEEFGYKTYGVFSSDFYFRGTIPSYDYSFPKPTDYNSPASILLEAVFMGEFRFDIGFDTVSWTQFMEAKHGAFSEVPGTPKFIYTHSPLPTHAQNSGICQPNEVELFSERLVQANREMRQDVDALVENDPTAIVIIAGDHGPRLTKNCYYTKDVYDLSEITRLDLQTRFGTFLAIRWPTEGFEEYDDITVLQDLFPAIFAYMFEDPELLEAKVKPVTLDYRVASGAGIIDGSIRGGIDHGEPLFTGGDE